MSSKRSARASQRSIAACIIFLCLSVELMGAAKPDRGAVSPADIYTTFESALKTKDLLSFMRVCNKPLANFSPGLSCGTLLNEAWYSERTYEKVSERTNDTGKAVIEIKSTKKDENQTLFFLIEKGESGLWVLKNINDNRTWSDQFLQTRSSSK